jgi:hypothetical protein
VRWLIGECVDANLATLLRESWHDVVYLYEIAPRQADTELMNRAECESGCCRRKTRISKTWYFERQGRRPGLCCCALLPRDARSEGRDLLVAIEHFGDALFGRYTVIEEARFRSRPLR